MYAQGIEKQIRDDGCGAVFVFQIPVRQVDKYVLY